MKKTTALFALLLILILNNGFAQITLDLKQDACSGKDAIIADCVPCGYDNMNFGAADELAAIAWTNSGNPSNERGLIQFDLSAIPQSSIIVSAQLSLFHNPNPASGNPGHSQLSGPNDALLQRITSTWDEQTVTWNTQPTITNQNEVTLPASTSSTQDYINIDVTALVQDMVNNPAQSFGFMLREVTETYYRSLLFASSDYPNAALHPQLLVTFLPSAAATCLSFKPGTGMCGGKDAIIADCVPCGYDNMNFGAADELAAIAWTNSGNPSNERGLVQFDLSSIPPSAQITSAFLSLFHNPNPASGNPGHSQLSGLNDGLLQRITSTWDESTVTWNTQPTITNQNEVNLPASTSSTQDYLNINVTALVQDMVNNPAQSFGFMLRLVNETYYRSLMFASSDHSNLALHPLLMICFDYPTGISENQSSVERLDIYPNPATTQIEIPNITSEIQNIDIYNAIGEKVFGQQLFANSHQPIIDITKLAPGMYIVKITADKSCRVGKFVKE